MFREGFLETPVGRCVLKYSNRKTLGISVLPDGSIELVAPLDACPDEILKRVHRRRSWIRRQKRLFTRMNAVKPELKYCSGATHRYLGKQYRLKVRKSKENAVKLVGGFFQVLAEDKSESAVKVLVNDWFRRQAQRQFERRLGLWIPWCKRYKLPEPKLRLRKMAKRWGSSHKNGEIFLNPDLVRTPSVCIDYVIAHEICHLKYPCHDRAFYTLLAELFPHWKAVKLRLEQAEF